MANFEDKHDPIVELLNSGAGEHDEDIKVISRDPFSDNFVATPTTAQLLDPSYHIKDEEKSNTNKNSNAGNNNSSISNINSINSTSNIHHNSVNHSNNSNNNDNYDDFHTFHTGATPIEPTGLTPMLAPAPDFVPHANNQIAYINKSSFLNPLPPMAPLSELVLPNGININPLALNGSSKLSNDDKKTITNNSSAVSSSKRKKEPAGPKTRPLFVTKIWSMVNDPDNQEYIRWNEDGKTFQVFHREEFMKYILPKYFKHSNFASFVRQLNMYGWHKVQDINSGTFNLGKGDKGMEEVWQFENPNFIRDREDLLDKIIRNKSVSQESEHDNNAVNFQILLNELDSIKMNQLAIGEDLRRVRKDNKTLWNENYMTRERHQQQAQTLDRILKFLAAVYGNNTGKILEVDNGPEYNDGQMTAYNPGQPPSPNPYAQQMYAPIQKPMLMLTNQAHGPSPSGSTYKSPRQTSISSSNNRDHRDSSITDSGSIEEIIRSYGNTPRNGERSGDAANNVNRIYQQIINQEPSAASPRHYFPELNNSGMPQSPYVGPSTPSNQQFLRVATPDNANDLMNGLEQNIYKQGQLIQQVQDWIQKLASQQQQQQASINEINDEIKHDLDSFDVNEFLNNTNDPLQTDSQHQLKQDPQELPEVITPGLNSETPSKRTIEEVFDGADLEVQHKRRRANQ